LINYTNIEDKIFSVNKENFEELVFEIFKINSLSLIFNKYYMENNIIFLIRILLIATHDKYALDRHNIYCDFDMLSRSNIFNNLMTFTQFKIKIFDCYIMLNQLNSKLHSYYSEIKNLIITNEMISNNICDLSDFKKLTNITSKDNITLNGMKFANDNAITQIDKNFLNHSSISDLNLKKSKNLQIIKMNFMNHSNVDSIQLPNNIIQIEECFLSNCTKLKTLDLSELTKLTDIKDKFLYNCNELEILYFHLK
jgi:hypothetical protein